MRLFDVCDVVDRAVVVCCRRRHLDLDRHHHHRRRDRHPLDRRRRRHSFFGSGRPDRVVPRVGLGRVRKSSKSVPGPLGPQNVKILIRDEYKNRSFLEPARNRDFRLLGRVGFWRGRILVL